MIPKLPSIAADILTLAGIVAIGRGVYVLWGAGVTYLVSGILMVGIGVGIEFIRKTP